MVCLHVKYKLSLHSKSSYPPSTVLQLPRMCSVAHALGWLICTIRIFAFCGALTHMYSAHSNFRLAGWLKTKSLVRTGIIPLALHIVERQNLPFSVQMLKGNVLHCTMPNSCPTPRNTQPCCRPPTSDGRSNADQFMKLVLGAAVQGAHNVCPIQDLQHCTGVSDGRHFHCLQHRCRALHCGEFLLPACMQPPTRDSPILACECV